MKTFLILSVIALIFSGCNTSEIDNTATSEIAFSLKNITGMNTRAGYDTPSDITSTPLGFLIYVVDDPAGLATTGNRADGHQIKWDGSTWFNATTRASGKPLEWPANGTVSAFAYLPFMRSNADVKAIPVQTVTDQSTLEDLKQSDFIVAKAPNCQKNATGTIPLTFSHQLSKLKFNIAWENQAKIGTLSSLKLFPEIRRTGTYNLVSGKITTTNNTSNPTAYIFNQTSTSATAELIIFPQTINKGKFLTVSTKAGEKDLYYLLSLPEDLILDCNTQYNFNIKLKPGTEESEITIDPSMISVERWDEVDKGDWDLSANVKKTNVVEVSVETNHIDGLVLVGTPSIPPHKRTDVTMSVYNSQERAFRGYFYGYGRDTAIYCPIDHNLSANKYNLTLSAMQLDFSMSEEGTTVEDELMSYKVEPTEIYIPEAVYITPVYNKVAGTIVLTASRNVKSDIVYRVFQGSSLETIGTDAIIPKGTTQSQAINVSSWNKNTTALVTIKYKTGDIELDHNRMFREDVYYHLIGTLPGMNNCYTDSLGRYLLCIIL